MKTIDEVIKALDNSCARCGECPYCEDKYCRNELENDALQYLKEYRETKKHLACMDRGEIRGDATQVVKKMNRQKKDNSWDKDIQHEEFLRESQERGRQGIYG